MPSTAVAPVGLPKNVSPLGAVINKAAGEPVLKVPDIIEFVVSDEYLNRPQLYPRQATLLKTIFLQDELFTDYDYSVLEEWAEGFTLAEAQADADIWSYYGENGIQPDILERIHINKEAGRKWFRECVVVIGRRGGKGYIGALCGAYVLWNFLAWGDPQEHYGIDRDKNLTALVFAGKLQQAKTEQWGDLTKVILGSNCFSEYVSKPMAESLSVRAPFDELKIAQLKAKGIISDVDQATFRILPKEATVMAGRGPASFLQYYDEMAWVTSTNSNTNAEEVYGAATPSLDQFKLDGFIYEGSSPWQMMGQFYNNWEQSLQIWSDTKKPVYPEKLMVQLTSWDIYKDWDMAPDLKLRKGYRAKFLPLKGAIQEYDKHMENLERANPETFAVERRSHWAAAQDAYLNPRLIKKMWEPFQGVELHMQTIGRLAETYAAHVDPSKSGANTGLAVAHRVGPDANGMYHVIFDVIKHWQPGDFPENDNQIDYIFLEGEWNDTVTDAFMPDTFTFDQFDASIIQRIRKHAREVQAPKQTEVYEVTATKDLNWRMAEAFKTALGLGLLHGPYYHQADLEMIFLIDKGNQRVDHPDMGPVQTKDVWDAMANVVWALIGEQMVAFMNDEFTKFSLTGAVAGGIQPFSQEMGGGNTEASDLFAGFRQHTVRRGGELAHMSPSRQMNRGRPQRWSPSSPWGAGRGR